MFIGSFFAILNISLLIKEKTFSTLTEVLHEVSKNLIPKEFANYFPSSKVTSLFSSKSDLFPIIIKHVLSLVNLVASSNHFYTY